MKISFFQNKSFEVKKINSKISIGPSSIIFNSSFENTANMDKNSCINRCSVGNYFGLGNFSYVADTDIGKFCTFASRVSVSPLNHPTNFLSIHEFQFRNVEHAFNETLFIKDSKILNKLRSKRTTIGNDVWIGDNSVILRGVNLNHGVIVAAGSVVTKNVDPFSIVAGNPAHVMGKRFEDHIIEKLLALKWWDLNIKDMKGCDFENIEKTIDHLHLLKQKKKQNT